MKKFWYDIEVMPPTDRTGFLEMLKRRGEDGWQLVRSAAHADGMDVVFMKEVEEGS